MISFAPRPTPQWRSEGPLGFLITTPKLEGLSPATRKGRLEMKAFVMMAALFSSALLTVPTVTEVGDAKVSELRLGA